jgi:hypothetical protein
MKRLLIFLFLATPAFAAHDYTLYPPNVPAAKLEAVPEPPPQTHTFCALDVACTITGVWTFSTAPVLTGGGTLGGTFSGNATFSGTSTFTGRLSTGNLNDILTVDGVKYTTIATAVTAAGSVNRTIILIPSTYAGSECPAYQANLSFWDFRGGNIICTNNSVSFNSLDASGVNALQRLNHTIQGIVLPSPNGSPVAFYANENLVNVNFNGSQADGSSANLNFFGAQSGIMPLASGWEVGPAFFGTASGNASTGGTVTLATGGHGYVITLAGSTTAITTAVGFDGVGCQGHIAGSVPVNCYGLYARRQLGAASARNYSLVGEGLNLAQYDSNVTLGGWDLEDTSNVAHHTFYVDGTNTTYVQAVGSPGLLLRDSAGSTQGFISNGGGLQVKLLGNLLTGNTFFYQTAPTIAAAGCGGGAASISNNNGTIAFEVNVGTTPGSACTITMPAAAHKWICTATDLTTNSTSVFLQKQSPVGSQTTTQIVITNFSDVAVATAFVASDIMGVSCHAY